MSRHNVIRDIHYLRGEIERYFGKHSKTAGVVNFLLAKAEAEKKLLDQLELATDEINER